MVKALMGNVPCSLRLHSANPARCCKPDQAAGFDVDAVHAVGEKAIFDGIQPPMTATARWSRP